MQPTTFEQANGTLGGGPAEKYGTANAVENLQVFRDGAQIISCWRPTWAERIMILVTGRVWLRVLGRTTHTPVRLDGRSPFVGVKLQD